MAFKVLTYVLLQSPAAPLKKALVDAGLGKDISGDFQDGLLAAHVGHFRQWLGPG